MKILIVNTWPEWPSARPYVDHSAHEIWYACDQHGVGYVRDFLGEQKVKGLTVVPSPDPVAFIEQMRAVHSTFPFERVLGLDEFTVLPAALVREHFNIPGPRIADVEPYRDKRKMKERVAANGIRVIRDLDPAAMAGTGFTPCVIKKTDGAASRGVHVCRTSRDFEQYRDELEQGALLEEYVSGDFFHVDGAFDSTGLVAVAHAYINNCYDHYESGCPLGSVGVDDPLLKERLLEFARRVIAALPLRAGIFHLEIIRTPDDDLVFLEIACRIGGGEIYGNFVDVYNFDLLEFCIASQLGLEPPLKPLSNREVAGWLMINSFEHLPGIFSALRCGPLSEDNCMYATRNGSSRLGRRVFDRARHFVTFALRGKTAAAVRLSIADLIDNVILESTPVPEAVAQAI